MTERRKKHSERALDERIEQASEQEEERGILEIFPPHDVLRASWGPRESERDEDAPLARDPDETDDR